eukprot:scaffold4847_cov89-Cylindrotheca_fusiformis.AAC.9
MASEIYPASPFLKTALAFHLEHGLMLACQVTHQHLRFIVPTFHLIRSYDEAEEGKIRKIDFSMETRWHRICNRNPSA